MLAVPMSTMDRWCTSSGVQKRAEETRVAKMGSFEEDGGSRLSESTSLLEKSRSAIMNEGERRCSPDLSEDWQTDGRGGRGRWERDIRTQISLSFASETLGAGAAEKIVCWAEAGGDGGVGAASEAMPSARDGRRG